MACVRLDADASVYEFVISSSSKSAAWWRMSSTSAKGMWMSTKDNLTKLGGIFLTIGVIETVIGDPGLLSHATRAR
eukprot:2391095-Prymnesium_polylepis.1